MTAILPLENQSSTLVFSFPGQGSEPTLDVFDAIKRIRAFRERYAVICEALQCDPVSSLFQGDHYPLRLNRISSLMTVLISSLSYDLFVQRSGRHASYLAGYSVGQWLAMHIAGMLDFEDLVRIIEARASLMDDASELQPGSMLGVIGLADDKLEALMSSLRDKGHQIYIANFNCVGQHSISGTQSAIEVCEVVIEALKPKKVVRLPVSGAWHCPLLADAEKTFFHYLKGFEFTAPAIPIIDNVSGKFLPEDPVQLNIQLAKHLTSPVLWSAGIKTLRQQGCDHFLELGYDNTLTKFGFFIDRRAQFDHFFDLETTQTRPNKGGFVAHWVDQLGFSSVD